MINTRRRIGVFGVVFVLAVLFVSCESVTFGMRGKTVERTQTGLISLPSAGNNETVRLDRGDYTGGVISSNKVSLVGRGIGATVIRGDLRISGNSCTVRAVTIDGNVVISGNNADLKNARVLGSVSSSGNNNRW